MCAAMKTVVRLLECAALLLLALVLWDLHSFIATNRATFETTLRDAHVSILEIGLTAKNLREASAEWKNASQQQIKDSGLALQGITHSTSTLTTVLSETGTFLNSSFFPALSESLQQNSAALLATEHGLQQNLQQSQATIILAQQDLQSLNKAIQDADVAVSNPQIPETLSHLAASAADLHAMADDGRAFIHRETAPVRGTWNFLRTIARDFGGLAGALVK